MEDWEDYDDAYWHYGEDFNTDEVYDYECDDTGDYEAEFGYYQNDPDGLAAEPVESFDVEAYDEAFAAYLDARKRFSDLKLSRGFLPVVALSDPSAGNLSPGTSSPTRSSGGGSPKGKPGKMVERKKQERETEHLQVRQATHEGGSTKSESCSNASVLAMWSTWTLCGELPHQIQRFKTACN